MNTNEEVIYVDSGVTLNEQILYKRVALERSISITESQFDDLWDKYINKSFNKHDLKKELGF